MMSDSDVWKYLSAQNLGFLVPYNSCEKIIKFCVEIYRNNLDYIEKNYKYTNCTECYLRLAFAFSNNTELIAFILEKYQSGILFDPYFNHRLSIFLKDALKFNTNLKIIKYLIEDLKINPHINIIKYLFEEVGIDIYKKIKNVHHIFFVKESIIQIMKSSNI
jgi:hypothetical protein